MAVTQNTYTGDGSTVLFSFTFPYLETTDIKVSVNGTTTTEYTLANATTVQFNTAPVNGAAIRIYRETDDSNLQATFYPGSAIRSSDLNDNFTQNLYVTQEANNVSADATTTANTALTNSNTAISTANTALSTANTADTNATTAVTTANTASTNASTAVSTANTASTNASAAVTTANSAATDAATALSTANTALSTANTASTNATAAVSTANTASSNATAAVSTANTASTNASAAVSTANTASSNASTALSTANTAISTANAAASAVANAILYDTVANVAAIPGSPANNDAVEVVDSTGIESFTPLSGVPTGFVGDSGLSVRLVYTTTGSTWNWIQYFPNDPETRYGDSITTLQTDLTAAEGNITTLQGDVLGLDNNKLALAGGTMTGALTLAADPTTNLEAATKQYVDAGLSGISADKIEEGNTSAEVIDTGSDGRFVVTTEGTEALRVDASQRVGIGSSAPQQLLQVGGFSGSNGITVGAGSSNYSFIYLADGTGGTEAYRGYLQYNHATDKLELGSAGATAVIIDSSQRVGIGTASPSSLLDVRGDWANNHGQLSIDANSGQRYSGLALQNNGVVKGFLYHDNTDSAIDLNASSGQILRFISGGFEAARLDTSGRLLVGTSSALGNYHQFNALSTASNYLAIVGVHNATNDDVRGISSYAPNCTTADGFLYLGAVGADVIKFAVRTDGDVQNVNNAYGAYSDARLKENIEHAASQWDDIKSLQVRKYNFKENTGHPTHTQIGLIAQEAELVSPGLVGESQAEPLGDSVETIKTINYSVLYMKAVKALQEAMERIETLEAKVAALESA